MTDETHKPLRDLRRGDPNNYECLRYLLPQKVNQIKKIANDTSELRVNVERIYEERRE